MGKLLVPLFLVLVCAAGWFRTIGSVRVRVRVRVYVRVRMRVRMRVRRKYT